MSLPLAVDVGVAGLRFIDFTFKKQGRSNEEAIKNKKERMLKGMEKHWESVGQHRKSIGK